MNTASISRKDFLFVYSKSLRNHLIDSGIEYLFTAKSVTTNQQFWLFLRNNEVSKQVDIYNNN